MNVERRTCSDWSAAIIKPETCSHGDTTSILTCVINCVMIDLESFCCGLSTFTYNPIIVFTVHTLLCVLTRGPGACCPPSLKAPRFFLEEELRSIGPAVRWQVLSHSPVGSGFTTSNVPNKGTVFWPLSTLSLCFKPFKSIQGKGVVGTLMWDFCCSLGSFW